MKKITLIDYYGNCDAEGRAIGHSPKVLKEYYSLVKDEYQVEAVLPKCIASETDRKLFYDVKELPYQIVEEGNRSVIKRVVDKIKLFMNISKALKMAEGDLIWFYRTDFFLFLYFGLHRKIHHQKTICLVYQQKFAEGSLGKLLDKLYQKGLNKFDGVIYSQKKMVPKHSQIFYMPDYYYDQYKYSKYQSIEKKNKAVCLGTMNPYKKLEELVDVFNKNELSLEIIGKFFAKERLSNLMQFAGKNIYIEDAILTEDTYYRKLAESQFIILPYDMKQYAGRTSGVLVEALFMQTVPVAPQTLLEENGVAGIGYDDISELSRADVFRDNYSEKLEILTNQCREYPRKEEISKKILQFLSSI